MDSRKERRRRAQSGTTLIELLVSIAIIGLVVVLLVGAISDALLDATLTKRNTAINAVVEYELDKIGAAPYAGPATPYSECFAVDTAASPTATALGGACPAGTSLRADVTETDVETGLQQWQIQVMTYPSIAPVGSTVSVYKADR
jgi:prepilin-type N-terminal cleavage/methylation domain-containing protein